MILITLLRALCEVVLLFIKFLFKAVLVFMGVALFLAIIGEAMGDDK